MAEAAAARSMPTELVKADRKASTVQRAPARPERAAISRPVSASPGGGAGGCHASCIVRVGVCGEPKLCTPACAGLKAWCGCGWCWCGE